MGYIHNHKWWVSIKKQFKSRFKYELSSKTNAKIIFIIEKIIKIELELGYIHNHKWWVHLLFSHSVEGESGIIKIMFRYDDVILRLMLW